jgi:hypothetical protein
MFTQSSRQRKKIRKIVRFNLLSYTPLVQIFNDLKLLFKASGLFPLSASSYDKFKMMNMLDRLGYPIDKLS